LEGGGTLSFEQEGALKSWNVRGVADIVGDSGLEYILQNDKGDIAAFRPGERRMFEEDAAAPGYEGYDVVGLSDVNNDGVSDAVVQDDGGRVGVVFLGAESNGHLSRVGWQGIDVFSGWSVRDAWMSDDGHLRLLVQETGAEGGAAMGVVTVGGAEQTTGDGTVVQSAWSYGHYADYGEGVTIIGAGGTVPDAGAA
jgi:hypothetical protein